MVINYIVVVGGIDNLKVIDVCIICLCLIVVDLVCVNDVMCKCLGVFGVVKLNK